MFVRSALHRAGTEVSRDGAGGLAIGGLGFDYMLQPVKSAPRPWEQLLVAEDRADGERRLKIELAGYTIDYLQYCGP